MKLLLQYSFGDFSLQIYANLSDRRPALDDPFGQAPSSAVEAGVPARNLVETVHPEVLLANHQVHLLSRPERGYTPRYLCCKECNRITYIKVPPMSKKILSYFQ